MTKGIGVGVLALGALLAACQQQSGDAAAQPTAPQAVAPPSSPDPKVTDEDEVGAKVSKNAKWRNDCDAIPRSSIWHGTCRVAHPWALYESVDKFTDARVVTVSAITMEPLALPARHPEKEIIGLRCDPRAARRKGEGGYIDVYVTWDGWLGRQGADVPILYRVDKKEPDYASLFVSRDSHIASVKFDNREKLIGALRGGERLNIKQMLGRDTKTVEFVVKDAGEAIDYMLGQCTPEASR